MKGKSTVLFVCVHNSGRSQMAEAFFNLLAGGQATAISAGTEPTAGIDPQVMQVMREVRVDMSSQYPKLLTEELVGGAQCVISMGCGVEETCPAYLTSAEDWGLDDPKDQSLELVRQIRDQIKVKVEGLLGDLGITPLKR